MPQDTLEMKAQGIHVPPEQDMADPMVGAQPRPAVDPSQLQAAAIKAPDPEEQKFGKWGRFAQALMGNTTEYVPNPETGQVDKVVRKRKPGEFWKSLVAGAILGGAMGAEEDDFAA